MSIIQSIRDKAAWIVIGAIALALIAFIVQDAFSGRSGGGWFGGNSSTIGKINGEKVDRAEYDQKVAAAEENYTKQGQNLNEMLRKQIRESLWNEYVEKAVYDKEFEKLGFITTDKERADILYGENPPQQLRQSFTDPKTGMYDAQAAYQTIMDLRTKNPAQYNNFVNEYVPALEKQRIQQKFAAMLGNSYYVPKWLAEKKNADNSQIASISYVNIPYATIDDSTVTVTDDDVRKYVDAHKSLYKQEQTRGIEYVAFSATPNAADTAALKERMTGLRDSFAVATDINAFLLRENSQTPYYNSSISRKEIQIANIDTIVKTPVGGVFGPYLDGGSFTLARIVSEKQWPEKVKARHILIATTQRDPRTGEYVPVRYDSTAKRIADSVEMAIRGGANFDSLCLKYSDDGTKEKGGIYDSVKSGQMVAEFNEFIFGQPVGAKGIVKTEFGYHYTEVLSHMGSASAYNIAYFSQPVSASDLTVNTAEQKATAFASESRTKQQFDDNVKKQNLAKFNGFDIKPLDTDLEGVGTNRNLIRWIFNDADLGDVAETPFLVGEKYIVPILVSSYEKGIMTVQRARRDVEFKIRNEKKAQLIIQKVGAAASLDAIASANKVQVQQLDSIQYSAPYVPSVGNELKLIGASFNKNNQVKVSDAIVGEAGVFYIKVNNISAMPNANLDIKQVQLQMAQQIRNSGGYIALEALKKNADITDNRYKFY